MKLTRLGAGVSAMIALALVVAGSTGNNLLYLIYGALLALLATAWLGRWALAGLEVSLEAPEQVFQGQAFTLRVRLTNRGRLTAYGVEALWQGSRGRVSRLRPGETATAEVRGALPHRGLNRLDDLAIETTFPFAVFRFRRRLSLEPRLANPVPGEAREAREVSDVSRASGRPALRKGAGEELFGVREYAPGDDARALNWKLSARLGRPLVNEYCAAHDDRVTVFVDSARGPEGERAVARAAAACRFHIDAGAQVRLESAEETVDYGRGLAQLDRLLAALARLGDGRTARSSGEPPALAAAPEPEDSASLRLLTLACLVVAFAGLFLIDEVDPRLVLALSPLMALGWLVQRRGRPLLPQAAWNALSLGVLAWTTGHEWRSVGVTVANVHLLIYLLLNRALTPLRGGRELRQALLVSLLAFFLTSGLTISVWYFALFLAYAAAAGAWLSVFAGLPWERRREWAGGLARSLAAAGALAVLLFAATPRAEGLRRINPFLAAGLDKLSAPNGGVTAFTEDVSLGFFGRIRKSSVRVMRVKPVGPPPGPSPAPVYVRGSAFDVFDGTKWSRSKGLRRRSVERRGSSLLFPSARGAPGQPDYEITLYPMSLDVLFTVGTPWLVSDAPEAASYDETDTIRFFSQYRGGARYVVHPSPSNGLDLQRETSPESLARYLRVPPDPAGRVEALAREAAAGAADPLTKAFAIRDFLRRRYRYTLYSDKPLTLDDFLFRSRAGNCEYFASAGVLLLRHAGVPARLASGFLADDWNEYGKFFDVRQADAHAWVEAYFPGRGWITLDPTPARSALWTSAEELSRKLTHWFSAFETGWYRNVIGYDQYAQRDEFKRLGAALSPERLRPLAREAAPIGLALLLPWLLAAARRRWRAWRAARPDSLFAEAQAALSRTGFDRPAWLTEREFAALVVGAEPRLSPLTRLAELRYLERFRPGGLAPDEAAAGGKLLAELRAALAARDRKT